MSVTQKLLCFVFRVYCFKIKKNRLNLCPIQIWTHEPPLVLSNVEILFKRVGQLLAMTENAIFIDNYFSRYIMLCLRNEGYPFCLKIDKAWLKVKTIISTKNRIPQQNWYSSERPPFRLKKLLEMALTLFDDKIHVGFQVPWWYILMILLQCIDQRMDRFLFPLRKYNG